MKNLDVKMDTRMDFQSHISQVVKVCRYHYTRRAWIIWLFLNEEAAKRIILATVVARLL